MPAAPTAAPRTTRRTALLVTLLALVAGLLIAVPVAVGPASASPIPEGYTYTNHFFEAHDGIQLHAGVFLPADRTEDEEHPVIMNIGPYTPPNGSIVEPGNLTGFTDRNPELWDHEAFVEGRYAYIQVDSRGYGGSEGCFEYYMPNEMHDTKTAIEWAAGEPWSTGKVGLWGKSYDAAQQVLALAADPEGLAAVIPQAPGLSAYTALWHGGVHYATGRYTTTGLYTALNLTPPQNLDTLTSPGYARAAAGPVTYVPHNPTCYADALVGMNVVRDRDDDFWADREPYFGAQGSDVPTFWLHGFWDANTKPEHLDIFETLTGPRQAWFGQFQHDRGHEAGVGRSEFFLDEAFRFLDEHVRGIEPEVEDPAVTVQSGNGEGRWRAEDAWPPADGFEWKMPVRPGSYPDEPGNNGTGSSAGQGHWTVTQPLPYAAHLAGEPSLDLQIDSLLPYVHTVAHLYDVAPDGTAMLVTRGARATSSFGVEDITVGMYPQDWVFEEGHRIAVHLHGSDDAWYSPGLTHTDVGVNDGELTLPLLRYVRDEFLEGGESNGMGGSTTVEQATLEEATVETTPPPAQTEAPEEREERERRGHGGRPAQPGPPPHAGAYGYR